MTKKRDNYSFGLYIFTENRYGTTYVECRVIMLDEYCDDDHPISPGTSIYREWDSAVPRHMVGLLLSDLVLSGFITIDERNGNKVAEILMHRPHYHSKFTAEIDHARAMVKTLTKVVRQFEKTDAYDPGDQVQAFCDALKLEWVAMRRENTGGFYFEPIRRAKNIFRHQVKLAIESVLEKEAA